MSEDNAQEAAEKAKEQARQAGHQTKAAAKSTGRAARAAAEPVVERAADETRDAAEKLEGTAQDAVQTAKKVDVGVLGHISGDLGVGFLALSVSIYSGAIAYAKFRQALSGRRQVIG